jgi:hypothetical protein
MAIASCEHAAGPTAAPSPLAVELQREIVRATNYDLDQVRLSLTATQVVVTVTNSNLLVASHPDRDADAARIAHVVEKEIAARSELAGVHAIHIDYLAGEPGAPSMKDSMDYRRDAAGRFQKDVS